MGPGTTRGKEGMITYELPLKLGVTKISKSVVNVLLVMVIIQNRFSLRKKRIFLGDLNELRKRQPSFGILLIK